MQAIQHRQRASENLPPSLQSKQEQMQVSEALEKAMTTCTEFGVVIQVEQRIEAQSFSVCCR